MEAKTVFTVFKNYFILAVETAAKVLILKKLKF